MVVGIGVVRSGQWSAIHVFLGSAVLSQMTRSLASEALLARCFERRISSLGFPVGLRWMGIDAAFSKLAAFAFGFDPLPTDLVLFGAF